MIWCTNDPNAHIRTFCRPWNFIWRYSFPVSILKRVQFHYLIVRNWRSHWLIKFSFGNIGADPSISTIGTIHARTQRAHHVESMSIRRGYYVDTSKTKFRRISTLFPRTFFDVISLVEKPTLFQRTLFDVISIVEKSKLFPRTFISVILLVENSALFPRTFFDVILIAEKSTLFPRTFFDVISMVEIRTLFLLTFFDVILMGKTLLMKTFEEVFLVFVTLNSWLLQDCFL